MYMTAVIDWHSRYIVGWNISDRLDAQSAISALRNAIAAHGIPAIVNSDQGSQFTGTSFTAFLKDARIRQSMDGKARWVDNVIIERWFRSLKCEYVYINDYQTPRQLRAGIAAYIDRYNHLRPHSTYAGLTPSQIYNEAFASSA
jgi:putative transposase